MIDYFDYYLNYDINLLYYHHLTLSLITDISQRKISEFIKQCNVDGYFHKIIDDVYATILENNYVLIIFDDGYYSAKFIFYQKQNKLKLIGFGDDILQEMDEYINVFNNKKEYSYVYYYGCDDMYIKNIAKYNLEDSKQYVKYYKSNIEYSVWLNCWSSILSRDRIVKMWKMFENTTLYAVRHIIEEFMGIKGVNIMFITN